MKKLLLLALVICIIAFSACSAESSDMAASESAVQAMSAPKAEAPMTEEEMGYTVSAGEMDMIEEEIAFDESESDSNTSVPETNMSEKIIYSADAHIETKEYDKTVEEIVKMAEGHGGFVQDSYISGTGYAGHGARDASFTLRIPSEHFEMMTTTGLSSLGSVLYCNTNAENVTREYFDIQSRLDSYLIQEERLLAMLETATTLEDMLTIEGYLAEVRYNIEYYQTAMNGLDTDVNYSTVIVYISEVVEYTPEEPLQITFFDKIGRAFERSIDGLVDFSQGLVLFIIGNWLVIIAVAVVAVFVTKRTKKVVKEKLKKLDKDDKQDNEKE